MEDDPFVWLPENNVQLTELFYVTDHDVLGGFFWSVNKTQPVICKIDRTFLKSGKETLGYSHYHKENSLLICKLNKQKIQRDRQWDEINVKSIITDLCVNLFVDCIRKSSTDEIDLNRLFIVRFGRKLVCSVRSVSQNHKVCAHG